MKTDADAHIASKVRRFEVVLCLLLPLVMGGCPDYRDDIAGEFETATRTALLGVEDEWTISSAVRGSFVDATIDLLFDQFRSDGN